MQNLEIKKLTDEKKDALAAQYAAEATLRRVHTSRKDDDLPSLESIIAPLEAEIKMCKNEVQKQLEKLPSLYNLWIMNEGLINSLAHT